jgi:hypothetical protein
MEIDCGWRLSRFFFDDCRKFDYESRSLLREAPSTSIWELFYINSNTRVVESQPHMISTCGIQEVAHPRKSQRAIPCKNSKNPI